MSIKQTILNYLNEHESAPSACCLLHAIVNDLNECPDNVCDMYYNQNEFVNDRKRDEMLNKLNDAQTISLCDHIIEILLEKIEE